ncbi:MAG: nitroreductase family deazaflavin-dependent oxidoreductase [Chloroflexi bacterium]|nr:nitroreductase family deazaflavin-dependent oxidoreductase [Chloroflexota bacterium]
MSTVPAQQEGMRQVFKRFNKVMIMMWRVGLGPLLNIWPQGFGQIMVLTHVGRKSGQVRQTPVNYAEIDGEIYCMAAFGPRSHWYLNIMSNPAVEVWLPDGWWIGIGEDASSEADRLDIIREILIASGFAAYAFADINPNTISDEQLEAETADYRLLRVRRTEARTGPGGPGEYRWIWPLTTMILLVMLWMRPRRR